MKQQPHGSTDPKQDSIRVYRANSGGGFRLEASQWLPRSREEVFAFFSDAFQLQTLTPPWLHFQVLTPRPIDLGDGAVIDYRLRIRGLPLRWQSRIGRWEPPQRFTDEQTRGPYRRWLHEHSFEPLDGGTLCRDLVEYDVYGGALMHALFVRRDLLRIFAFRQQTLRRLFS